MVEETNQTQQEQQTEQPEKPEVEKPTVVEQEQEQKQPSRNEIMRELSQEYGFNLFDAEGIKQYKDYLDSQKTEQQKLQEQYSALEKEKTQWQNEKLIFEGKLKASELGIHKDYLDDALKLANNDPKQLDEVIKKYPMFKTQKGVKIGVQETINTQQPNINNEAEAYMAQNPIYKNYLKK